MTLRELFINWLTASRFIKSLEAWDAGAAGDAARDVWAARGAWAAARNAWAAAWDVREKQREIFISYLQPEAQLKDEEK